MITRKNASIFCIAAFIFIFSPFGVLAQSYEATFKKAAEEKSISYKLAMSIAQHESNMNPFAINVAGRSFMPKTKQEAIDIIQSAIKRGMSHDIGLMQVNSQWVKKWGMDPLTLLDPEINIHAGVRILAEEIYSKGFSWEAVGAYHSPKPEKARRYAWTIYGIAQKKFGLKKDTAQKQDIVKRLDNTALVAVTKILKLQDELFQNIAKNQQQAPLDEINTEYVATTRIVYRGEISKVVLSVPTKRLSKRVTDQNAI